MIYIVTFTPNRSILDRSAQTFHTVLQQQPTRAYVQVFNNVWMIVTQETPDQVQARLLGEIQQNDRLLIVQFTNQYGGWLPQNIWDWIDAQIRAGAMYR